MDLTPWRPTGELSRLRREMDDLWSGFFGAPAGCRHSDPTRTPYLLYRPHGETAFLPVDPQ